LYWQSARIALALSPTQRIEIEGEVALPIQVHSEQYYFYCGVVIFIFITARYNARRVPYYKNIIINNEL
jgi:hypothetical protein